MGEILNPVGYNKLIDGGTHHLFKLHLQVTTRQWYQLGQPINIDVAREVVFDKVHNLKDIIIGNVIFFSGLPKFKPGGLDDDVKGLFDGTANHPINQPAYFIPSLLYIRDDGRYGWIGQVANQLVIIHTQQRNLIRYLDVIDVTDLRNPQSETIVTREQTNWFR